MNGSVYVGQKALSLTEYEKTAPISGVILWVDDDNCYEAGDETGTVIEQDCPYASQEMANSLLATMQGYSYQGLEANGAKVSPIAELGDGLTVNGLYTQLAYQNIRFSTGKVVDVAAPGSDETLHEYKTEGQTTKQFTHQIAQTRSVITKTAEEIRLYVVNEIEGVESSLTQTANSLTAQINSVDGRVTTLAQTVDGFTLSAETSGTKSTIALSSNGISLTSADIVFSGLVTFEELNGAPGSGATLINGAWLQTGTVSASSIIGEQILLRPLDNWASGVIMITGATTSTSAIELRSYGALRLTGMDGDVFMSNGTDQYVHLNAQQQATDIETITIGNANLITNNPSVYLLGLPGQRWKSAYLAEPASIGSDAAIKNSISYDAEKYNAFFDLLKPAIYKYNHGESGRYHLGFIAQDVEAAVAGAGMDSTDFAGYMKDKATGEYSLRYEEFISLCVDQIQRLKRRVNELEGMR